MGNCSLKQINKIRLSKMYGSEKPYVFVHEFK
nr:MAG TPA: hypothetical protein [Caudoviricetes sp.]